ncbi:MAG: TIM barrel protein [Desulfurococcales archaeon]|jgi:xylose isomerase|nr:TIM barrel protein [Desulfurococcales archaeon]
MRLDKLYELDRFKGFVEKDLADQFLETFEIKFGAGTWVVGDFNDRFMRSGYNPGLSSDVISRIERIKKAGVKIFVPVNMEFFNEKLEVDWDLVDRVRDVAARNKMIVGGLGIDLSGIPDLKMGSISNPDPVLRRKAFEIMISSLDIAKKLNVDIVSFWPGQDGWDYSLEINYGKRMRLFIEELLKIVHEARERKILFAIEAKPKEPKEGNMIIPTSHVSILIAKKINEEFNEKVMGITIDYGHELMYSVEPGYTVYLAHTFDVPLLSIHLNAAKTHSNDEDRIIGTGDVWQLIDFLYATIDTGFEGCYILDQFPYRMDPVKALTLSKEFFVNIMRKVLELYRYREEFEKIRERNDQADTLNFLKKIIL